MELLLLSSFIFLNNSFFLYPISFDVLVAIGSLISQTFFSISSNSFSYYPFNTDLSSSIIKYLFNTSNFHKVLYINSMFLNLGVLRYQLNLINIDKLFSHISCRFYSYILPFSLVLFYSFAFVFSTL